METESKDAKDPIQIFFNSQYFGDLKHLIQQKDVIKELLNTILNEQPGELYTVYKKQNDLLDLNPAICYFPPPYPRMITTLLKFTNKGDALVAFKIKSKQPKKFAVKPREGLLQPGECVVVDITITKDQENPKEDDKFKVECVRITDIKAINEKNAIVDAFTLYEKAVVSQMIDCACSAPPTGIKVTQFSDKVVVELGDKQEEKVLTKIDTPVGPAQKDIDLVEKSEKERLARENELLVAQKIEQEKQERATLERQKAEKERIEKERLEKEAIERQNLRDQEIKMQELTEKLRKDKEAKDQEEKQRVREQELAVQLQREELKRKEAIENEIVVSQPVQVAETVKEESNVLKVPTVTDVVVENNDRVSELQSDVQMKEEQLTTTKAECVNISTENKDLKSKQESLVSAHKSEVLKIQQKLDEREKELNRINLDLKNTTEAFNSSSRKRTQAESDLALAQANITKLQNEIVTLGEKEAITSQGVSESVKLMQSEFKTIEIALKDDAAQKETKIKNLVVDNADLRDQLANLIQYQKEKESITPENHDAVLSEKQVENVKLSREIVELKKKLNEESDLKSRLEEELDSITKERDNLTVAAQKLESSLKDSQKLTSDVKKEKSMCESQISELKNQLEELESQIISSTNNNKHRDLETEFKVKISALVHTNEDNQRKIAADAKRIADLVQFEEISKSLMDQIAQLKKDGKEIKSDAKDSKDAPKEIAKKPVNEIKVHDYWIHVLLSFFFFIFGYFFK